MLNPSGGLRDYLDFKVFSNSECVCECEILFFFFSHDVLRACKLLGELISPSLIKSNFLVKKKKKKQVSKTCSCGMPPSTVAPFEFPQVVTRERRRRCKGSGSDNSPCFCCRCAVIALACLVALFNPLFVSALGLNKRIGGFHTQQADLRWDESGACVIVPLTAFIAYFKKVISLYQHQAENCRVLVLSLVSF